MKDISKIKVISFDCYGTLIDWESGICGVLKPYIASKGINLDEDAILEYYAEFESSEEAGFYRPYREVLKNVLYKFSEKFGFDIANEEEYILAESISGWEPFPDTNASLIQLKDKYEICIISNIDKSLFARTAEKLKINFNHILTSEDIKSYKPSKAVFMAAESLFGVKRESWLHAGQSIYHDINPSRQIGIQCAHIDRRAGHGGFGATPESIARPDLYFPSLKEFSDFMA